MLMMVLACLPKAPVNQDNVKLVAEHTMEVAHPTATLLDYSILASEQSASKGRYSDVQMRYQPVMQDPAMMTVRYYVLSVEPCRVDVELLSDTGLIPPVLLNEWASEASVANKVCDSVK